MPLYTFECFGCGHRQDEIVRIAERDRVNVECDKCGLLMDRVPTVASFALKGAGFHVNDYPKGK